MNSGKAHADFDPELLGTLCEAFTPIPLPAPRHAALRSRVLQACSGIHILRHEQGRWQTILPGVEVKALRVDAIARTQTSLWRLAAGASIPAHDHSDEEECLVLDGQIQWAGILYGTGDYLLAKPGLHHTEFVSPSGAMLMISSELTPHLEKLFSS